MTTLLGKSQRLERIDHHSNRSLIQQLESTQVSQNRRIVLLSLRKPLRLLQRNALKQLIYSQKRPYFSYTNRKINQAEANEHQQQTNPFEFNIRNLISKSVPHVSLHPKETSSIQDQKPRHFRINREVKTNRKAQLEKARKDYITVSQKIDINENLREKMTFRSKQGLRSHRNKVTFYMNNFLKTRYAKPKKEAQIHTTNRHQLNQSESNQFFPWEKSVQIESENGFISP